jgi:ABC-type Fe3+-hydroxamate transport system substrate-binding protein
LAVVGGPGAARVVSLVPSVTETLLAWGVVPVACTRFCGQPGIPTVGGTKTPDVAAIVALAPDLVVMDAEENRREDRDALAAAGVPVMGLHVRSVADVDAELGRLGAALGVDVEPVTPAVAAVTPVGGLRVFVPIWRRPWMALGAPTYGTSLLAALGAENVCADRGPYPAVDPGTAADLRPDLVVAPDEPYPFGERHRDELARAAPVVFVDGRDLFWWGARTPAAARRLGATLAAARGGAVHP